MVKTRTSRKRTISSKNLSKRPRNPKIFKLKKGVKLTDYDPYKNIANEKFMAQAFWECLKNNDPEGAMEMISIYINAVNKMRLSEEKKMSRSTIYNSMKKKNPTIKTVAKIIHFLVEAS